MNSSYTENHSRDTRVDDENNGLIYERLILS